MTDTAAYEEAALDLGRAVALGMVPMLGQAIDLYDTLASALALYQAPNDQDKDNARFDLLLAIVGWIPGPGDGVKKSLRIVERDPQRYAPVLFDLLRHVLSTAGVKTSPEALLEGIFDAGHLRAQMATIKHSVRGYAAYQALPPAAQRAVMGILDAAEAGMPAMVGLVERRLANWKRLQRNSSARAPGQGPSVQTKPERRDAQVHQRGKDGAVHGHAGGSINATLGEKALHELSNELIGISGEHIADYMCAYSFGWGGDWQQHDDGGEGRWSEGAPGKAKTGKLSRGGSPKSGGVLYKLDDGANGVGIDAVWRASGRNHGKPYAIVEAKATRDEDAPKFLRRTGNTRKPGIVGKLADNVISDPSELIEPNEDAPTAPSKKAGGKAGGKAASKGGGVGVSPAQQPKSNDARAPKTAGGKPILVQMSREWIEANIGKAVGRALGREVLAGYSRHLFFSPAYHPSGSPKAHMLARLNGLPAESHTAHDAFHYDEHEVKAAVNKRKKKLREKHGNLPSLREEK